MLRIDIRRFDGDSALCATGWAIGKRWCEEIVRLSSLGQLPQLVREEIVKIGSTGEVHVRARVYRDIAGQDVGDVWITALGGCSDIPPFLLKKAVPNWYAYYTDGVVEQINPITRSPRPNPDPAVRTKKVKIPTDLENGGKRGAMFSGLMRMAVQCAHARGVNTVFLSDWSKTHGILAYIDQAPANAGSSAAIAAVSAANRYWVVEASASGVFAAPVAWTGKCCDGFSVSKYKLSTETALNLASAFTRGVSGVVQLIAAGTMAAPYAGNPFHGGDGWAFSRSGQQAQNVTAQQVGRHYRMERWALAFSFSGPATAPVVAASVSMLDSGDVFFPATNPLWVPSGPPHKWTAIQRFNPPDITVASGPIHVYFRGESAFVTRYEHGGSSVAYGITEYGDANYDKYGNPRIISHTAVPQTRCGGAPFDYQQDPDILTSWYRDAAFTGEKSGFVNAMASTVKTSVAGVTTDIWRCSENGGSYQTFADPAYLFNFACCNAVINIKKTITLNNADSTKLVRTSTSYTGGACCILLHQEREGILVMTKTYDVGQETAYDNPNSGANQVFWLYEISAAYAALDHCWTDVSGTGIHKADSTIPTIFTTSAFPGSAPVHRAPLNYDSTTGNYYLALGLQSYSGALPTVGTAIRPDIDLAFTNPVPARELEMTMFALHGGMSYAPADPAAVQPANFPALTNQVNSNAYLFPTNMVTNGGFLSDGFAPVAFVGQA